jgi:ubiquinone biosynthesis protein UbiJ
LQYQNKALASANKELKQKIESLNQELTNKLTEMHSVEVNIGSLASTLI